MSRLTSILVACVLILPAAGAYAGPEDTAAASGCQMCHAADTKMLGPSYKDIAAKYASEDGAVAKLSASVRAGSKDVWGPAPMIPVNTTTISDDDLKTVIEWILTL